MTGYGSSGWGSGLWGGTGGLPPPPPDEFDLFCYAGPGMPALLTDPNVTITSVGGQITVDGATDDVLIDSSTATSTADAQLSMTANVPQQWTLEVIARFDALPLDFSDLTNSHIFFNATDASGPCAGLFISQAGVAYAGSVHHVAGNMVLDSTIQQIPLPMGLITTGEYLVFRIAADLTLGAVYIYITSTSTFAQTGHVLRAVLPVIPASSLGFPATDRALITVRGTAPRPSSIALATFCLSSELLIPNLLPVADSGEDQAINFCSIALLDGSGSFDPEGAPLTYLWRLVDGPDTSQFIGSYNDGTTYVVDATGFTNTFHSSDLGLLDAVDPIVTGATGDVLLLDGVVRTITGKGTDINGFFVLVALPDIPDNLSSAPFRFLRQRGINDRNKVKSTFFPDVAGFYKFDLTVNDGGLDSEPSVVILNVLESPLPRNCTPDMNFMFDYLSDFWKLVEDKDQIPVFWSAISQVAVAELYTLWQHEYSKSLRDIQRTFNRQWLHFDLLLGEPLPELTKIRAVWGGVELGPIPVAGLALSGLTLAVTSDLLDDVQTITVGASNPVTAAQLASVVNKELKKVDSRFSIQVYSDQSTTDEYVRINAPFPFDIDDSTTLPTTIYTEGSQNRHPFDTSGGAGVNSNTYKVSRSLQGLDIKENDFLSLDGVAYRISRVVTDSTDDFPYQRVVVKETLPTAPSTAWDITGYVTSELMDFYHGLVAAGDAVFFEVSDKKGEVASKLQVNELRQSVALGACEALPSALAFDPLVIGDALAQSDDLYVRLAKVVRRTYLPIDPLVKDIPILTAYIHIDNEEQEQAALRRNLDFFLDEFRGQACIRFVSGMNGDPDIWESALPPDRLWSEYTYIDNTPTIEANFGLVADFTLDDLAKLPAGVDYLSAVRGLWYAYFNGPTLRNLRIGTQILLGLPFAEVKGVITEIRTDFSPTQGRILVTDDDNNAITRFYLFPIELDLEINPDTGERYAVGDTVQQFAPLVEGAEVIDYVKDPTWFQGLLGQGIFREVEKYFKFLVRVDSAAFNLSALLQVREFILQIKPTYTYPFFLVQLETDDDDVSITDQVTYTGTLSLFDNTCGLFLGASTMVDEPWASKDDPGGGTLGPLGEPYHLRNQVDHDSTQNTSYPTFPTADSPIPWGVDKNYLCPADGLIALCCNTLGGVTPITVDGCFQVDTPIIQSFKFRNTSPVVVPVGPAGLSLTSVTSTTASFTSTIEKVRLVIIGGPGGAATDYELVISIAAVDQTPIPFTSLDPYTEVITAVSYAVNASDVIGARIRPASGGPESPSWLEVRVEVMQPDSAVWMVDTSLSAGTYCSEIILAAIAAIARKMTDTVSVTDDLQAATDYVRENADSVSMADSAVGGVERHISEGDSVSVTDSVSRQLL